MVLVLVIVKSIKLERIRTETISNVITTQIKQRRPKNNVETNPNKTSLTKQKSR